MRGLAVGLFATAVLLQLYGRLATLLDAFPTTTLAAAILNGATGTWALAVAVQLVLLVSAVALGAVPAHLAARRQPRDELKVESGSYVARRLPRSPFAALVRTDRGSVWRAVPMRRGVAVLAVGPGLVALAGDLTWSQMTILPGLVASGGALLFGVNTWCLDGRGALWRDSLPVSSAVAFFLLARITMNSVTATNNRKIPMLAAGLPTVASPVGVNQDILRHGVSGFLAGSASEWEAALRQLADHPARREEMGEAGRRKVEREYSTAAWASTWVDLLESL